eukprot:gene9533-10537_t
MVDYMDLQRLFSNTTYHFVLAFILRTLSIIHIERLQDMPLEEEDDGRHCLSFLSRLSVLYKLFRRIMLSKIRPDFLNSRDGYFCILFWKILTSCLLLYYLFLLPLWFQCLGYRCYARWDADLGSKQPSSLSPRRMKSGKQQLGLPRTPRLTRSSSFDTRYEELLPQLYRGLAMTSGQSFLGRETKVVEHLTNVHRILCAWRQPEHLLHAGLFHCIYGTPLISTRILIRLHEGRNELREIIGEAAEELVYAFCTCNRLVLVRDLIVSMYGYDAVLTMLRAPVELPHPPLIGALTSRGYPVHNYLTNQVQTFPADFFAQFSLLFVAHLMEQGAAITDLTSLDVALFRFSRFRFCCDVIKFVQSFVRVIPPVMVKYMWNKTVLEPNRYEIMELDRIWSSLLRDFVNTSSICQSYVFCHLQKDEQIFLVAMTQAYPYIAEVRIALASSLSADQMIQGHTRKSLAKEALQLLEEWGMLTIKGHGNYDTKLEVCLHAGRWYLLGVERTSSVGSVLRVTLVVLCNS